MRRDRDGELLDEDRIPSPEDHACDDGWLAPDPEGHPRPCPTCKPHVAHNRDRMRRQAHLI
ncbi:MAG: hypothetical protein Q7V58_07275 [Actinomycetota bacterium]|nr:hypothetical protein [Actinomycetota bacterium]